MKRLILKDDDATNKLGSEIAKKIIGSEKDSIEIHLQGDLGAGKTFISRSIIKNCGWDELVKSPTYTLCEEYELPNILFLHIDLYRTEEAQDIDIFNLDRNISSKKIVLIEWPERLQYSRDFDLKIEFTHIKNGREVLITSKDNDFSEWADDYE